MSNYKSYYLKSLGLREDTIVGENGAPSEQLKKGIAAESAHTQDDKLATNIAKNHINEDPEYYSRLQEAGMPDANPDGKLPSQPAKLGKLVAERRSHPSVIAVGVRGTRTGLLPAGGIVEDPEKARLGGFELVQNKKPNSQGTIADTPASDEIKSDGGHFTPDNKEITKGKSPKTAKKGDDEMHPMQVQQIGNEPFEDDGTTHDGESTPPAAGGDGRVGPRDTSPDKSSDKSDSGSEKPWEKSADKEPEAKDDSDDSSDKPTTTKGPWGIEMDGDREKKAEPKADSPNKQTPGEAGKDKRTDSGEDDEKDKEGKDVDIDIKEGRELKERFMKLANIKGADPVKQLQEIVARMEAKGKKSPLMERAVKYLKTVKK